MARFAITLKHLNHIEYDHYHRMQGAFSGSFSDPWDVYSNQVPRSTEAQNRKDSPEIAAFQSDIADLTRRRKEIEAAKQARRSS